ncbi:hypothetical protein Vretifemale_13372, partial [Volvox reticuliferus]
AQRAPGEQAQAVDAVPKMAAAVPRHLKELVGAAVMREPRGCGRRDGRKLGVSSYLGRQGRAHRFQIVYEDGEIEEVGLPELRARLAFTTPDKKNARSTAVRCCIPPSNRPLIMRRTRLSSSCSIISERTNRGSGSL